MATITQVQTQKTQTVLPKSLTAVPGQITVKEISNVDLPDIPLPPPSTNPTEILAQDKGTPDNHVPRDPRLIRLTGVHPFNVEPPLTSLFNEGMNCLLKLTLFRWAWHSAHNPRKGFLTSPELFYVRNHGPVPLVREEDIPNWEISIEG
jgi:nitrate reductase (NAD(P)H)